MILAVVLLMAVMMLPGEWANAQDGVIPLRVEVAVTGTLTSAAPTVVYSVDVVESLRMAVIFDVIEGDMVPSLVVLDQDQTTTLAGSTGPNNNGLVVEFPSQGTYYIGLSADAGTSATYRLIVNAAPVLPLNTFVLQSFLVAGTSNLCSENKLTPWFVPTEDLNVCFTVAQVETSVEFEAEWWSPSGEIVSTENATLDNTSGDYLYLTGLVYQDQPWETGWWQVHLKFDGELAHIQWVPVMEQ
jgi:hypothetical protein